MMEVTYDMRLECVAQGYMDRLGSGSFTHNAARTTDYAACGGSGYVGENWYSGAPQDATTGGAAAAWVDFVWPIAWGGNGCSERQNYLRSPANCAGTTGHYTQVLWADSMRIGCGYTAAGGTVCNYSPGGNFNGQSPYTLGTACSQCPAGTSCNAGLCSSSAPPATSNAATRTSAPATSNAATRTSAPATSNAATRTSAPATSNAATRTSAPATSNNGQPTSRPATSNNNPPTRTSAPATSNNGQPTSRPATSNNGQPTTAPVSIGTSVNNVATTVIVSAPVNGTDGESSARMVAPFFGVLAGILAFLY